MVLGELACGSLHNRARRLQEWRDLPALPSIGDGAAMDFLHRHARMSNGIVFIAVHLLAATAAATAIPGGTRLWTRDQHLAGIARRLGLAFSEHDA